MPHKGKNLRSGDIAEHFALYVLNSYAFAINYPRQEDFGIDAIVTLQSELDKKRLTTEESFYIQIKARSIKKILYKSDEIPWLKALKLPFFIGRSDPKNQKLELFCMHRLNDKLFDVDETKELVIDLERPSEYLSKSTNTIGIGPPVIVIELGKTTSDKFYSILKGHINLYNTNLFIRPSKFCYYIEWQTGKPPKNPKNLVKHSKEKHLTTEQIILKAREIMEPFFYNWINEIRVNQDFTSAMEIKKMLLEAEKFIDEVK